MKKIFTIERKYLYDLKRELIEWIENLIPSDSDDMEAKYSAERITIVVEVIDENRPKLLKEEE